MRTELKSLEEQVSLLLHLYHDTRDENSKLKKELAATHTQCELLNKKINIATDRLEVLLHSIPNETE